MKTVHEILNPGGASARVRAEVIPAWQPARPTDVQPERLETSRANGRTTWHFRLDERTAERLGIMPMVSLILGSGRTPDDRTIAARWELRTTGHYRQFSPYSVILCTPWTWPLRRDEALKHPGRILMEQLEDELGEV